MLSSKITKALKVVLFCIVLIFCSKIMTFLLYPFSSLNERFYRYHNIKENIDFLVLGNSLENCGIVPSVLDKNLGQHCGVLAPQGSYPESLYYLLVDVAHTHKVKTLLAGWDVMQNFQLPAYKYPHAEELYREFFADMKENAELQKIVFKNIMEQRYTSTFFDWSSFPENVREIPRVIESRKKPVDLENKITTIPMDISKLKDDRKKDKYNYYQATERIYGTEIQENDKKYFLKIQKYCKEHDINLYVISSPIPNCIYESHPELNEAISVSEDFFREHNIPYIDTRNSAYFEGVSADTNYFDCFGHFISPANEKYSQDICNWLKDNGNF